MKAIILAGGFGTRLRERVQDLPKPMAPVAGRPFLEYLLDQLVSANVDEIILSVGYQADKIKNHFGKNYRGVPVRYTFEKEPLGTGGAVRYSMRGLSDKSVLILNGDSFLNLNFTALISEFEKEPKEILMVLREVDDVSRYGSVKVRGDTVVGFLEKGETGKGYINAGIYIISPAIFKTFDLTKKFSLEIDVLQPGCSLFMPRAYISDDYFIDIGVPEDYDKAQNELPLICNPEK